MNYENEEWRDIVIEKNGITYDYTGLYEVSNMGRVRSLDRINSNGRKLKGKIMERKPNKDGYMKVGLSRNGKVKTFQVHRLVATMFIPNPENLPVVNHLDENPSNCNVDNLEWCSQQYNVQYSAYKRTGDKHQFAKKVICLETEQVFNCIKEAGEWLSYEKWLSCGITSTITLCCQGKRSTAGGLHWMYLDDYKRKLRMESDTRNSQAA